MKNGERAYSVEAEQPPKAHRRRRRTRQDVLSRISESAQQLFGERGYAAATTKEVAQLADVSETLLFRHYGSKAALFDAVVTEPFRQLMDEFVQKFPDPTLPGIREGEDKIFTRRVFELFERNEAVFQAVLAGPSPASAGEPTPGLNGLTPYFDRAADQVMQRYAAAGLEPAYPLDLSIRLTFGMIASSVLMRKLLFPDRPFPREELMQTLEHLVADLLSGPIID